MIDPGVTRITHWLVLNVFPRIKAFLQELFSSTIFDDMSSQEKQIYFTKIAIYALIILCIYRIGCAWARKVERRDREKKNRQRRSRIQPPERKWSPTGWYWDDEKQAWIPPDYLSKESQQRWRWDPEKRIWIDKEFEE